MCTDQVRTRIFNMIAEYRRIMKNPTQERRKKCIFFDALHKYYAKYNNPDLISYGDEHFNYDPLDFSAENNINGDDKSDTEDRPEMFLPPSPNALNDILINDGKLNHFFLFLFYILYLFPLFRFNG